MKKTLQNIWAALTGKERTEFTLLLVLDLLISIIDILALVLLFWIIRFYIEPLQDSNLTLLPQWIRNNKSIALITIFFILFALKNLAGYAISVAHNRFISRVTVRISKQNLEAYQDSSFTDFVNIDSSVFIRRIAYRPFEFGQYMLGGLQQVITQSFLVLATVTAILVFNAKLFLFLLVILLPPVVVVFYFIKRKLALSRKKIWVSHERSFKSLFDALKGYVEGNIYERNSFFLQRFISARQEYSRELYQSLSLQQLPNRVIEVFAVMGLFILITIASWGGSTGTSIDFLTIGAFMAAAYKIIPGMVKIINANGQIKAYELAITELPKPGDINNKKTVAESTAIKSIEFRGVYFSYPEQPVLKNISFKISPFDFTGIRGVSGKGKTTILNLILGFLPASPGEILFNNKLVAHQKIRDYWPQIAYVRQQNFFINDTILMNITLQDEAWDEERLNTALCISGVHGMLTDFPQGIQTMITENGKNISGGQQQRIAIARALYKDAPVILLDEPFNELDEASELRLLTHFKQLADTGRMVILITHNTRSLSYCNKIISLDEQP